MEELERILAQLVDSVDGALSAAVGGMDGLLIEQYPQQGYDLSPIAAEQTNVLNNTRLAYSQALEGGPLREVIVVAERLIGYTRLLNDDLFCMVIMNPNGNLGKARLYSEGAAQQILAVLV